MTETKNQIHFAVVGYGHIGKRHAAVIHANEAAKLIAICDIDPAVLQTANVQNTYAELGTMLQERPEIEVVNICSPNGLHAAHALVALQANKHVVIEKPMALHTADCDAIIALAAEKERQVFCVMQNRFSPPAVWIKDLLDNNRLGNIYMVQVHCFWNRDERYYTGNNWHGTASLDGGTLFTQFSHFIDTMLWLFGEVTDIQAQFADFNHQNLTAFEDSGNVQFRFLNGALGTLQYSTAVHDTNFESSMRIIGEHGTVCIGGQYMNEVTYCHIRDYTMPELAPTANPNHYGSYSGSAANHHFILQNVIDVLQHNAPVATTAHEGRRVVDLISRIYALRPHALTHKS